MASVHMDIASGRAKCIYCKEIIKKGELNLIVTGYQWSGRIHAIPQDCKAFKEDLAFMRESAKEAREFSAKRALRRYFVVGKGIFLP